MKPRCAQQRKEVWGRERPACCPLPTTQNHKPQFQNNPPLTAGNVDPSREWKGRASGHTELSSLSHPTLVTYPEMSPKQA